MGQENFEHVRTFLYTLIKSLHQVGGGRFKFALTQYNSRPQTEFHLNTYPTMQDILEHIKTMSYRGGGTRTGLGLEFLIRTHLTSASGSCAAEGVAQVVVVLTDGRSQDDVGEPAKVLQMAGVQMFAVGVQDAVDWELREMASQPQETHVCCNHTGSKDGPLVHDWSLHLRSVTRNVGAANFPYVRDWVTRVIERLSVGRDEIRVALVQYDNDPEIKFFLNSYYQKSSVLEAVKGLTYSGGDESNLGAALEEVAESLLRESAGGRAEEGAPQVLVIISATVSSDDTGAGHRALMRAGVVTLGVPIGDDAAADLEEVATDKSFVLKADSFRTLTTTDDPLIGYITGLAMRSIIFENEFAEGM
ncbi:hypothetical protein XENOCAPTIV_027556 [Xenoophorus captivus]|uniref:VWFA domain-containing protein n=1 Tax=Xenoophorus captivus TaxID=1517983 RepID=A0ABV0Q7C7_9TELE